MIEVLYGPEKLPKGIRSFPDPTMLVDGEFVRLQNFRWDVGLLTARAGTALYLAAPDTGVTLVDLIPVTANGTHYLLGFFSKSTFIRIYMSTQGSAWQEISEVGGFSGGTTGNTRFATDTGRITVSVVKAPQGYFGGAIAPSRDVAIISNGADDVRLWDPGRALDTTHSVSNVTDNAGTIRVTFSASHNRNTGDTIFLSGIGGVTAANGNWTVTRISATVLDLQGSVFAGTYTAGGSFLDTRRLTIHKKLTIPTDASVVLQKASFHRFWELKSGTKTYFSTAGPPAVNDTAGTNQFDLSSATIGSSSAGTPLIVWGWGTATVAGQIATVYRPAQPLTLGKGLILITEDILSTFGADFFLSHVKIEVNREDVAYNTIAQAWSVVFDPSSTDERERRYDVTELANEVTSELPRKQWYFPVDHLSAAEKTIYHIRFTRLTDAPAPASLAQVVFLAMASAGSFPGGSEATISYEDETGRSESSSFVASDIFGAPLADIGGPLTLSSAQAIFKVPISTTTFYDYDLVIRNSDAAAAIEGGLNGEPSRVNVYFRCPDGDGLEPKALYMYSISLYEPGAFGAPFDGLGWLKTHSTGTAIYHQTSDVTDVYGIDWTRRQIDRFAPSRFQIAIQPHYASLSKNGRFFWGNIKDEASQQQRGDGYFSGWGQPFRNQALYESSDSGNRFVADGESIQAFVSSAAGSQGVSHIHVLTNKWLYPLGGSGSAGANPLDANTLGVLMPAVGRGTNSHRTVCEKDGAIFYVDNTGQQVKVLDGAREISRLQIDDKFSGVPSARIDDIGSAIFKSRVYTPYTLAAGTTNTRIVGFNDLMGVHEFDDLPPVDVERICVYYDSSANGSGQKLLIGTQAGIVYEYESGTFDLASNPIAIRITTRTLSSPDDDGPIQVASMLVDVEGQANTWTFDRLLTSPSGTYRTTLLMTAGWVTDSNKDHTAVVAVASDGVGESRMVQLDIYGNMTSGTRLRKLTAIIEPGSSSMAAATT